MSKFSDFCAKPITRGDYLKMTGIGMAIGLAELLIAKIALDRENKQWEEFLKSEEEEA